jgi:hypothetical protein
MFRAFLYFIAKNAPQGPFLPSGVSKEAWASTQIRGNGCRGAWEKKQKNTKFTAKQFQINKYINRRGHHV